MAGWIADQLQLKPDATPDSFVCQHNPVRMGNAQPIAYGGCALAGAVMAAFHTVDASANKYLYSLTGVYLGPASSEEPLRMSVQRLRDTKTFSTRLVLVSQKHTDGSMRTCLSATADFIVSSGEVDNDRISLLRYNDRPLAQNRPHHSDLPLSEDQYRKRIDQGDLDPRMLKAFKSIFGPMLTNFEHKPCPDGLLGQTLNGIDKARITTQENLPMTRKHSSQWLRLRESVAQDVAVSSKENKRAAHTAALAFLMDGALSFIPLSYTHRFLDDAAACSSLDFACRFFVPSPTAEDWLYQEHRTIAGGFGRTYSEGRVWSEDGTLVACMTQASIMRPLPAKM